MEMNVSSTTSAYTSAAASYDGYEVDKDLATKIKEESAKAAETKTGNPSEEFLQEQAAIFERSEVKSFLGQFSRETITGINTLGADLFDLFQPDVQETPEFSSLKDLKSVQHTYHLIENEHDAEALAHKISVQDYFCFDTETTGTNPIIAQIVGLSICFKEHEAFYVAMPKEKEGKQKMLEIFRSVFENPKTLKIGQNIKYDILILENYGIKVQGPMFDTMIAHYILQPELHHGMDYLAEIYLNYKTVHIEELIGEKGKGLIFLFFFARFGTITGDY